MNYIIGTRTSRRTGVKHYEVVNDNDAVVFISNSREECRKEIAERKEHERPFIFHHQRQGTVVIDSDEKLLSAEAEEDN
jgi:hypothetical protein